MSLVEVYPDGTLLLNWKTLPEEIQKDTKLRDKIFNELKSKYPPEKEIIDNKLLFEMNRYVINRIQSEAASEEKKKDD